MPGNIPGQVGRGSEQPDLFQDIPAHCRPHGSDGLYRSLPAQPRIPHHFHLKSTKSGDEEEGGSSDALGSGGGGAHPRTLFDRQPLCILPAGAPWQSSAAPRLSAGSSSGSHAAKPRTAWAAAAVGSLLWLSGVQPGEKGNTRLHLLLLMPQVLTFLFSKSCTA